MKIRIKPLEVLQRGNRIDNSRPDDVTFIRNDYCVTPFNIELMGKFCGKEIEVKDVSDSVRKWVMVEGDKWWYFTEWMTETEVETAQRIIASYESFDETK